MVNKVWDIRDRTFEYSLHAIRLFRRLQEKEDRAGWILSKQYLRSATSIGANIEEAHSAESKADFIHKYSIAQKEANESLYWLRLFNKSEIIPSNYIAPLISETKEIIAIITSIIVKSKKNK